MRFPARPAQSVGTLLFLLLMPGCGGGGGPPPGGNTTDAAARTAALDRMEQQCNALSAQHLTPAAFTTAMEAWLKTQPEYEATGVDLDTLCAWARFKDHALLIVTNNRPSGTVTRQALLHPAGPTRSAGIPTSKQARLLHTFGKGLDGIGEPIGDLSAMLTSNGYTLRGGSANTASLATLRGISGDGFFYFNTHGGTGKSFTFGDTFCMQSSTLQSVVEEVLATTADDIKNERLVYLAGNSFLTDVNGNFIFDTRYGVTAKFVEKYWSFAKNSVLFFNVCHSANPAKGANLFIAACHKKNAGLCLGWSNTVHVDPAFGAIRRFVDRMLGANDVNPENPKQRAFDYAAVLKDMLLVGLTIDGVSGAVLTPFPNATVIQPLILAPSIERMLVDEDNRELQILGSFGDEEGKVEVGGSQRPIVKWERDKIRCQIPDKGAGSAGDVQVTVQDHKSNVVQLTEWRVHFTLLHTDVAPLRVDGTVDLHFRADVHAYRDKPHDPPIEPTNVSFQEARDTEGKYTASGTYISGGSSITWAGTVNLVAKPYSASSLNFVLSHGEIDTKTKKINLAFYAASANGMTNKITTPGGSTTSDLPEITGLLDGFFATPEPVPSLKLTMSPNFDIPAGKREVPLGSGIQRVEWTKVTAAFPPDPAAARSVK